MEFNDIVMVEHLFCRRRFVKFPKSYVPVVLVYSSLYRSTTLSDVDLTTLAGYAVNPRSPESHVVLYRTKDSGDLPRRQAITFNVVFGQHSAEPAVSRLDITSDRGWLLFLLGGSNRRVVGPSYLFDTITIFPKSGFEEPNSSWGLYLSQRALAVYTNVERTTCMLEGSRIHIEVNVSRFSVDLMAQGAIQSPIYVNVKKGWVAVSLCLDGELHVPVKAIQMVKKSLQLICSMWPDDKGVINITEPALRYVGSLC